jgi:hypothetical protein
MDTSALDRAISRRSMRIYLPVSLGAALLFFLASAAGGYPWVARIGGAAWVGLLSLIVSMPAATSQVKRRARSRAAPGEPPGVEGE